MSKERDEKANERRKIMTEVGHHLHGTIAEQNFRLGWDQALDSEAVKKLIEALELIKSLDEKGYISFCGFPSNRQSVLNALEEFNKAKAQGGGE